MKAEKRIQAWMHGALMLEVTLGEAPPGGGRENLWHN